VKISCLVEENKIINKYTHLFLEVSKSFELAHPLMVVINLQDSVPFLCS